MARAPRRGRRAARRRPEPGAVPRRAGVGWAAAGPRRGGVLQPRRDRRRRRAARGAGGVLAAALRPPDAVRLDPRLVARVREMHEDTSVDLDGSRAGRWRSCTATLPAPGRCSRRPTPPGCGAQRGTVPAHDAVRRRTARRHQRPRRPPHRRRRARRAGPERNWPAPRARRGERGGDPLPLSSLPVSPCWNPAPQGNGPSRRRGSWRAAAAAASTTPATVLPRVAALRAERAALGHPTMPPGSRGRDRRDVEAAVGDAAPRSPPPPSQRRPGGGRAHRLLLPTARRGRCSPGTGPTTPGGCAQRFAVDAEAPRRGSSSTASCVDGCSPPPRALRADLHRTHLTSRCLPGRAGLRGRSTRPALSRVCTCSTPTPARPGAVGAWMSSFVEAVAGCSGRGPVVANCLDVAKPAAGDPALLSVDEVEYAFDQFGQTCTGLSPTCTSPGPPGTGVPRDFVEFPSQVNQFWVFRTRGGWPATRATTAPASPCPTCASGCARRSVRRGLPDDGVPRGGGPGPGVAPVGPGPSTTPADDVARFETAALQRAGRAERLVPRVTAAPTSTTSSAAGTPRLLRLRLERGPRRRHRRVVRRERRAAPREGRAVPGQILESAAARPAGRLPGVPGARRRPRALLRRRGLDGA